MKQVHGAECKVFFLVVFLFFVHFQYFSILKKCNMKKVQYEKSATWKSATWKKCNMKKVQRGKSATWKECSMEKVQHEKNVTMEKMQRGNSRRVARTQQISKTESFATIFNGFVNYFCKVLHLRCLWGSWQYLWQ